jgi:hypothetical protein
VIARGSQAARQEVQDVRASAQACDEVSERRT